MLVTFHSNAWSSITLFGDVALTLLKMAGHSGTVPSAIVARDVPAALQKLQQALAATAPEKPDGAAKTGNEDGEGEPVVGLHLRAFPLIQMLTAAAAQGCDVMWEEGAPAI